MISFLLGSNALVSGGFGSHGELSERWSFRGRNRYPRLAKSAQHGFPH